MQVLFYLAIGMTAAIAFAEPAYAYLDPGTGSMIIQVIIGAIAAGLFSIKLFWHRLKIKMAAIFKRSSTGNPDDGGQGR